jgi:hypothetical protein
MLKDFYTFRLTFLFEYGMMSVMKVKFIKQCKAPYKSTTYCGDGCCSWDKWIEDLFFPDQIEEAIPERANLVPDGTVDLSGLKFGEDYTIIEFP